MPKANDGGRRCGNKRQREVIFLRLTALGDVAMTLPFVYAACRQNPSVSFTFVTTPFPARLFVDKPDNLRVIPFHKKRDKTLSFALHLHKLFSRAEVVDLHVVPRTRLMSFVLSLPGHRVARLRKPRRDRLSLIRRPETPQVPIELYVLPMTRLYGDTLRRAGLLAVPPSVKVRPYDPDKRIGLALFAQHEGKMLLPTQEEELVSLLSSGFPDYEIRLYGAGVTYELERRKELATPYPNVTVSTPESFEDELSEIAHLSCMVSMDSANQHIARFLGVPVVSLWMQTHPAGGFLPFGMDENDCIGVDLSCRPCSIYGNKPCRRRDWACKRELDLTMVTRHVRALIGAKEATTPGDKSL